MTIAFKSTSKEIKVQAIIPRQLQNQLPGLVSCISTERIAAPSGFFMCVALLHLSMVGRAGELKSSPGSLLTGKTNSVRLTTQSIGLDGGVPISTGARS